MPVSSSSDILKSCELEGCGLQTETAAVAVEPSTACSQVPCVKSAGLGMRWAEF